MDPFPHPEIASPGMHIFGWMSPAELDWLHARAAGMSVVVEIGTNRGRSAWALATGCAPGGGLLYAVDLWDDEGDHGWRAFHDEVVGCLTNVTAIRGRSPGVLEQMDRIWQPRFEAEMVFIDGDHSLESVLADIDGWLPRTSRLICGHDYVEGYEGVVEAVDLRFGGRAQVAPDTSIWFVEV